MTKARKYHGEGYNCAESIIKAFNDETNLQIPVAIASPFGSGMTVGATCGAMTGAMMAVGAVSGRESGSAKNESKQYAHDIMNKLKEKYGTYECSELKRKGFSCDEIIDYTFQVLTAQLPHTDLIPK